MVLDIDIVNQEIEKGYKKFKYDFLRFKQWFQQEIAWDLDAYVDWQYKKELLMTRIWIHKSIFDKRRWELTDWEIANRSLPWVVIAASCCHNNTAHDIYLGKIGDSRYFTKHFINHQSYGRRVWNPPMYWDIVLTRLWSKCDENLLPYYTDEYNFWGWEDSDIVYQAINIYSFSDYKNMTDFVTKNDVKNINELSKNTVLSGY